MKILHFNGSGKGMMAGISEYIVLSDDDSDLLNRDHLASGFKLDSVTELITDLPSSLPLNMILIPF